MELKDYQTKILESLDVYLHELKKQKEEKIEYFEFQQSKGKDAVNPEKSDYCHLTWEAIKAQIQDKFTIHTSSYTGRKDGLGRNIPNVCFKVPTGGGKTILAANAVQRINHDYLGRNNSFVLWIVPSETIYTQTSKHLRNKEHPYRQMLDRINSGKTLILEKQDSFNIQDVQDSLNCMLLMLQSSNRENKETLKFFRDSGRFGSFFPEIDDFDANKKLLAEIPNLDVADLSDDVDNVIRGISIKHSLGNVLRMLRPIVIIDEGHRATTQRALETINSFNPSFILELSATPKENSNILVNIGGAALKKEQMIKLPINIYSNPEPNWQHTLNQAHNKLISLNKDAATLQGNDGRYIRPIMVIKAETKKKGDTYDHVEDIKKYLINHLEVREDEIRIKLSEKNELKDEELLDKLCPVKYIITKDALKEGWDCSFAYILAILSNTKGETSLTQFIGRVLRQPEAKEASIETLNQCYVYCNNSDVNEAVASVKKGLESEGMGDVANNVVTETGQAILAEKVTLLRNSKFTNDKVFLPTLNVIEDGVPRHFDYYRDILEGVKWEDYNFNNIDTVALQSKSHMDSQYIKYGYNIEQGNLLSVLEKKKELQEISANIDISLMTSQLMEKVPNPWQATRIVQETISALKIKNIKDDVIALNSVFIVEEIKRDCFTWILKESEAIFKERLNAGNIFLKLMAEPFTELNWQMAEQIESTKQSGEAPIELENNIFQPQYLSNYNGLEKKVAYAINNKEAVKWWHRLAVKGSEYAVQGWKRDKIYPDFLIKMSEDRSGVSKVYFIETKGDHLAGNPNTEYKQKVFEYLNTYANSSIDAVGEVNFINTNDNISFHMVFEDTWENGIHSLVK